VPVVSEALNGIYRKMGWVSISKDTLNHRKRKVISYPHKEDQIESKPNKRHKQALYQNLRFPVKAPPKEEIN